MNAKVVLAVGITALVVSVVLIGGFLVFLYQRPPQGVIADRTEPGIGRPQAGSTRRPKGAATVPAAEVTKVTFLESEMANPPSGGPAAFLGNINVQNFASSTRSVTFSADGSASKETSSETTVNGNKLPARNEKLTGSIDAAAFAALAQVLADNDFANEPDSRDITSLPIKKILTITYKGGEKVIIAGHMGKDTPELSAMLAAVRDLERKVAWRPAN